MNYMKKTIRTILCLACFAVLVISCQKEIEKAEPVAGTRETIEISINGLMGEYTQADATRASLVNTIRVAWEGGESVYVYDGTKCLGSLASTLDGNDNRYAILSGTIDAPAGNKLFLVYSPLLSGSEAPEVNDGAIAISLASQNSEKAPFVVYASLDYAEGQTGIENLIVPFYFATSVIRVSCTGLEPDTAITSAGISNVNTSCVLSFADGAVTASGAEEGTITRLAANGFDNVNIEGDASFQFAVPALGTSTGRTLAVKQGDFEYTDENFSKASINANLSVNTICTMLLKDTITPDSPVGTIGAIAGRKAVVVNLYGTRYAVALMNEGATSESGDGSYGGFYNFYEAYTFFRDSDLGIWRVPTMEEMQAFTDRTREYDSTTPAVRFMSAGGPISFPLAGMCFGEELAGVGEEGNYYTSTHEGMTVCCYMVTSLPEGEEQPVVNYIGSSTTGTKCSLRLFYQLTETNADVIHGGFTVSASGKKVNFSKGNLYYDGTNWGFEAEQYYFRTYNGKGKSDADGYDPSSGTASTDWGLFGCSTEGKVFGMSTSMSNSDYPGNFLDWGTIVDNTGTWRTLTGGPDGEWKYLFDHHVNVWGTCNGVPGRFIAPDGFEGDAAALSAAVSDWENAQKSGIVFLPAAGYRYGSDVCFVGSRGFYWSSSAYNSDRAYYVLFDSDPAYPANIDSRFNGYSVRLVTEVTE